MIVSFRAQPNKSIKDTKILLGTNSLTCCCTKWLHLHTIVMLTHRERKKKKAGNKWKGSERHIFIHFSCWTLIVCIHVWEELNYKSMNCESFLSFEWIIFYFWLFNSCENIYIICVGFNAFINRQLFDGNMILFNIYMYVKEYILSMHL